MKLLLLACVILSGCEQPPQYILEAHAKFLSNPYKEEYSSKNMQVLKYGEAGNCARFAASYLQELADHGYGSELKTCTLKDGRQHMYVFAQGWVLDNRFKTVTTEERVGCK